MQTYFLVFLKGTRHKSNTVIYVHKCTHSYTYKYIYLYLFMYLNQYSLWLPNSHFLIISFLTSLFSYFSRKPMANIKKFSISFSLCLLFPSFPFLSLFFFCSLQTIFLVSYTKNKNKIGSTKTSRLSYDFHL